MCFSAAASFSAAAVLGAVGAATLAARPPRRLLPLAATPLLFAAHQAIEGAVWLDMSDGTTNALLVGLWVFIAKSFWPVYTPLMVFIMERGSKRRIGIGAILLAGVLVSALLLWVQASHDYTVEIAGGHLRYSVDHPIGESIVGLYLLTTVTPLFLSRSAYVEMFGVSVLIGSIATQIFFEQAGASVWCFFAAVSSLFIFLAVRDEKRAARASASQSRM